MFMHIPSETVQKLASLQREIMQDLHPSVQGYVRPLRHALPRQLQE